MTAEPRIISSDMRYLDKHENLMRTRTELAVAQMLEFLGHEYKYDHKENFGGFDATIDFKTDKGFIEVIDGDADIEKYTKIKESSPGTKIMAIGHPKYASKLKELQDVVFYDQNRPQTGSIFLEDESFICFQINCCKMQIHGHTSACDLFVFMS